MNQEQVDNTVDKNFEKIKDLGAMDFIGISNFIIAEEWLQNTERILDLIDCTKSKRISYVASLFELDILSWQKTIQKSENVMMIMTWIDFLKIFTERYFRGICRQKKD